MNTPSLALREELAVVIAMATADVVSASGFALAADKAYTLLRTHGKALSEALELIEKYSHDGHLQTFEDRQRFRAEVAAILTPTTSANGESK